LQSVGTSGINATTAAINKQQRLSPMLSSQSRSTTVAFSKAAVAWSSDNRAAPPVRRTRRLALAPWISTFLLMYSGTSFAGEGEKLFAPCVACHGTQGEGNATLNSPAIAGQDAAYVQRQLLNFRNRRRGTHKADTFGAQMQVAATALAGDAAVAKVASYVANLPKTISTAPASGNLHNGKNLYNGTCGACHGGRAEGNPALKSPRLAGLDTGYLKRQFEYFRDGVRGTDPQDTPGRQMAMMAKTLPTERDLDDIIAFIHQQGRPK
jgi:cytochrome c553